jgi:predicted nucleic acid-binding protein
MPEVIVNTSPLQYLYQLGLLDLLPAFYGQTFVPEGVARELSAGLARGVALPDVSSLSWLRVQPVTSRALLPLAAGLGMGEREVLALALESAEPLVVLDDSLARRFARRLDLPLTGTLGLLLKAKQTGCINQLRPVLRQLQALEFRLDRATRENVLKLAGER